MRAEIKFYAPGPNDGRLYLTVGGWRAWVIYWLTRNRPTFNGF